MVRKRLVYLVMMFMLVNCNSKIVDEQCIFVKDDVMQIKLEDVVFNIDANCSFICAFNLKNKFYKNTATKKFRNLYNKFDNNCEDIDRIENIKNEYNILINWIKENRYPLIIDSNFDHAIRIAENDLCKEYVSKKLFDLKLNILRQEIIISQIKFDSIKYEANSYFDSIQFNPFHHDYLVWE
jgi:hypothetical protein